MLRSSLRLTKQMLLKPISPFSVEVQKLTKEQMRGRAMGAMITIQLLASMGITNEILLSNRNLPKLQVPEQFRNLPLSESIIQYLKKHSPQKNEPSQNHNEPSQNQNEPSQKETSQKEHLLDQSTINYFIKMMDPTQGIALPNHMKQQDRTMRALNQNRLFSFFPNKIVTPQIFGNIILLKRPVLLTGPAGSGKTSNLCFYSYLSSLITKYQFQYEELSAESKFIPRTFYLTYKHEQESLEDIEKQFMELLRDQCPTEEQFNTSSIHKASDFVFNLRRFYEKKGLRPHVIVDQFDTFVGRCLFFNKLINEHKQKNDIISGTKKAMIQEKQRLWKNYHFWVKYTQYLSFKGQCVIFNSSVNIEDHIFQKQKIDYKDELNKMYLGLSHHSKIKRQNIQYLEKIETATGFAELIYGICFELLKHCKKYPDVAKKIKQAQNKIFEGDFLEKTKKYPITLLQIRQRFQKPNDGRVQDLLIKIKASQNHKKTIKNISEHFKNMYEDFIKSLKDSAKLFCGGQETYLIKCKKKILLFALRVILINSDSISFSQALLKQIGLSDKFKVTEEIVDKNLFILDQGSFLQLKVDKETFLEVTDFVEEEFTSNDFETLRHYLEDNSNALLGNIIETAILKYLRNYPAFFHFEKKIFPKNKKEMLLFTEFLEHPLSVQQIQLEKRFENIFKQINEDNFFVFAQPVDPIKNARSTKNPTFDLLVIERDTQSTFIVNTVDFTVSKQTTDKENKAKALIQKNLKQYVGQRTEKPKIIQWNHYILASHSGLTLKYQGSIKHPSASTSQTQTLSAEGTVNSWQVQYSISVADIRKLNLFTKETQHQQNIFAKADQNYIKKLLNIVK